MKLIIVHPGVQHSYRLANAAQASGLFEKVYLLTSVLFHATKKSSLKDFRKRIKPIHSSVIIKNHYVYEFLAKVTRNIYNRIVINPNKQVHNNPIYFWQFIFGMICLPHIWWNRKNCLLVTYETAAWPVVYFAKLWGITVIMDFPSISHEVAKTLGINETNFGISIKKKERAAIDYALFCSEFCKRSFEGLTSSKEDFVLYLGAEASTPLSLTTSTPLSLTKEVQEASGKMQDAYRLEKGSEYSVWSSESSSVGSVEEKQEIRESQELKIKNKGNYSFKSETLRNEPLNPNQLKIKISFIANLEYRKGLDILLEALYSYEYKAFLEVHLIGKIRPEWVNKNMPKQLLNKNISIQYKSAMSQSELFSYLREEEFDLNLQPSRFDSFAMVVPETMMQGIPNIVSPFVGAGEMIKNKIDGFVMQELSAKCLVENIKYFLCLTTRERLELKKQVMESASKMTWESYNLEVRKALLKILNNLK